MFLSFVVPVYNVEKYLEECLDSLLNQDIPKEEYEIICVNDGSTDGSLLILKKYQEQHLIKLISIENSGVSVARNRGIEAASGDYIWMVDSDDLIPCNILSNLYKESKAHKPDIVDFGAYNFYNELTDEEKKLSNNNMLPARSFANHVYITRSLFRREFLNRNNIQFITGLAYSEDSLFKCECLLKQPSVYRIEKVYYLFRYRSGSATAQGGTDALKKKRCSYRIATLQLREYYSRADGALKEKIADLLMSNLWLEIFTITQMPAYEIRKSLKSLSADRLFPFVKPQECTLKKSYMTTRTDFAGKLFDKIYINMHRPCGFMMMTLLQKIIQLKRGLRK